MKWYIEKEKLSDGSIAYNVTNSEYSFHCIGLVEADTLLTAIGKNTTDDINRNFGERRYVETVGYCC